MRASSPIPLLLVLAAMAASGCGGGGNGHENEPRGEEGPGAQRCEKLQGESAREECEKAEVAKDIPEADRIAYYQLATTAGLIRAGAVAVTRSAPPPERAGGAELKASAARVAQLKPEDGVLELVRARITRLLGEARAGFSLAGAKAALVELRAIDRALNRYVRYREPAQAALVPE